MRLLTISNCKDCSKYRAGVCTIQNRYVWINTIPGWCPLPKADNSPDEVLPVIVYQCWKCLGQVIVKGDLEDMITCGRCKVALTKTTIKRRADECTHEVAWDEEKRKKILVFVKNRIIV